MSQPKLLSGRIHRFKSTGVPALLLAILGAAVFPAHAATRTWSGGGANANWTNSANWSGGTPASGDTLVFPAGTPNLLNTNNIAGLTLDQIRFAGAGGGYEIQGNSFTLTNGIVATNTVGTNIIVNDFTMATNDVTVNVGDGARLVFQGLITSSAGLTKIGAGTLELAIPAPFYSGATRINAGMVELNAQANDYAFGGGLVIGDGTGTGSPVLRMLSGSIGIAMPDNLELVVNEGGLFDLNGHTEDLGSLRLSGGAVTTGGGNLILNFGVTTVASSGTNTISGNLVLNGGGILHTFTVMNGGDLAVSASVSDSNFGDGVIKAGDGNLRFQGANSYPGLTIVQAGWLWAENAFALGGTANGTIVSNGASLVLNGSFGITNESLELNGGGVGGYGALDTGNSSGTNIWAGPITVNATSTFAPYNNGAVLRLIGPISGAGGLTEFSGGAGQLILEGSDLNTYAGTTTVQSGLLLLNKSIGVTAVPGSLVINSGSVGGNGTVGDIFCAGNLLPGNSPGSLTGSNVSFTATGNYFVELTGLTPGTGYDQLKIRGTNNVSSATLHVTTAFTAPVVVSNQFVIMDNDGAEANTGTFSGLSEGASISAPGYDFTISYAGGTGNDVVLTLTAVHPGASENSLATVTTGNGNGAIDPNECNHLAVVITNLTTTPMTGVSAVLSSLTPGVAVTQPLSGYPDVGGNGMGTNVTLFQIITTPAFACGTTINLLLTVTSSSHGPFVVPVVLPSGLLAVPSRYDVNTAASIPNPGTIESTNVVAGFSGPLKKVVVSLSLTYPYDEDLNISLISPDGVVVDLSSANGGSGQNYGNACTPDADRTTFDDAAATAITSGSAPFVGTFQPEGSLATMIGGTANGNWRLRIDDTFAEDSGNLNCWSLFLYPVGCDAGSGVCELCPNVTLNGTVGDESLLASDRLARDGVLSSCGAPESCPGENFGGSRHYEQYVFRNGPSNACITVTLNAPAANLSSGAYLGSFNSASVCVNYLADSGDSTIGPNNSLPPSDSRTYSFNVGSNQTFVVVVWEALSAAGGPFSLTVTGGDCRPQLNILPAGANKVLLDWTTASGGYQLESTNALVTGGSPIWPPVTNPPVVINSRFHVTNNVTSSNLFYHLRKPVP